MKKDETNNDSNSGYLVRFLEVESSFKVML